MTPGWGSCHAARVSDEAFIYVDLPEGWDGYDEGIPILVKEGDGWWDEDMWQASGNGWVLDVGVYGGVETYVCIALREPVSAEDWQNPDERVEFKTAREAVAWIQAWFKKLA